jgi:hypothetical protein
MDSNLKLTTKRKAFELNMDNQVYGSFAEIGGGQEVAAYFFKVGSASGTIAKTMSAYDMAFSDAIYGASPRYVCEERLVKMLKKEFSLMDERLTKIANRTCFFAFANTVETINYEKTNQGHGWVGMRFQLYPMAAYNECIIHVRLNDSNANWQQEALGIIGVNLIYSCFHSRDPDKLTSSLIDNLDKERVEVDMFRISGPDFKHIDNRLLSLLLVKNGLSKLAMFDQDGNVQQPSEALYKKNVLILRGRFKPVTHVNVDMMLTGYRQFRKEPDIDKQNIVALAELNLYDLKKADDDIDLSEYLQTADLLNSLDQNVIISGYKEYYKLVNYMAQFTRSYKMGIILGIYNLHSVFDESYYSELYGGILEAFGILFGKNIKLYVYPSQKRGTKEIYELKDFEIPSNLQPLLQYLISNNKVEGSLAYKKEHLNIISDDVLEMIRKRAPGWEEFVPNKVAEAIRSQGMFNYKPPRDSVKA